MADNSAEEKSKCPSPPERIPNVRDLTGLALSGGGIRSASFNLGVLQGLSERNVLWIFDYLSTVSGGGFVGSWWSAWLSRSDRTAGTIFPGPEELEPMRRQQTARLLDGDGQQNVPVEALPDPGRSEAPVISERDDPIHFLRTFSNYLTPKTGIASPDTWRLIAWYIRSLLFTWAALLPVFCAVILLAQAFFLQNQRVAHAFVCAVSPAVEAVALPVARGPVDSERSFCSEHHDLAVRDQSRATRLAHVGKPFRIFIALWLTLALLWLAHSSARAWLAVMGMLSVGVALALAFRIFRNTEGSIPWDMIIVSAGAILFHVLQGFLARRGAERKRANEHSARVTSADHRAWLTRQQARVLKFGTFGFLLILFAGFAHDVVWFLFSGSNSVLAGILRHSAGWGGLILTVVSGAYTVIKHSPSTVSGGNAPPGRLGKILVAIAPALVVVALTLALATFCRWLIVMTMKQGSYVLIMGNVVLWLALLEVVFAVFESRQDPVAPTFYEGWRRFVPELVLKWFKQEPAGNAKRPWYAMFVPRLSTGFAGFAGLWSLWYFARDRSLQGIVSAIQAGLGAWGPISLLVIVIILSLPASRRKISLRSARPAFLLVMASATALLSAFTLGGIVDQVQRNALLAAFLWVAALIGLVIGLGWLADPNLLSMHGFYKGRLTRAYLGASNRARDNEKITEAAPGDDIKLTDLWNHAMGGPYHLVNTTLNLVGGSDLATAQRLAENFIMSKYHCGSARAGYRCSDKYMSGELTLGTAAAISGAAVSPTMGSGTPSAALSLLLSLMSVRLGYWAPTPAGRRWNEPHARLWPFYLLRETLANTGELGTYSYLTDGGHFDNTGVYALVERGCRFIVCCDCGADPDFGFNDIGNTIRRCRIDFGTEILLDLSEYAKRKPSKPGGAHVVRGRIKYQPSHLRMLGLDVAPDQAEGTILWIKPVVRKRDAGDVRQYKLANDDFPQQSTADQWYDESQFESYRRLGYDAIRDAFDEPAAAPAVPAAAVQPVAPSNIITGDFTSVHLLFGR
jgi:predicted acylesterase/phospholipase RssA